MKGLSYSLSTRFTVCIECKLVAHLRNHLAVETRSFFPSVLVSNMALSRLNKIYMALSCINKMSVEQQCFNFHIRTVHLDIISFTYSPTDELENCLKKHY